MQDVNRRLNELVEQQRAAIAELQRHRADPPDTDGQAPELMDRIGQVEHTTLETASERALRAVFDAFALSVANDPTGELATVEVTVDDGTLAAINTRLSHELGTSLARSEGFEPPTF